MSGREIPSQRQSRARRVVKGTAALDPAPHRNRFNVKKTENVALQESEREVDNHSERQVPKHTLAQRMLS